MTNDQNKLEACRLCGGHDLELYYVHGSVGQYRYYKCHTCKLVNYDLSGGLDQSQYVELHLDPEDDASKSSQSQDQSYDFIRRNIKSRGRLIDIGCGNGRLLKQAKEDGWQVKGLDLSPEWANLVKSKLDIDVDVANFLEFDETSVEQNDFVVLRHVLEHLPDSLTAMRKIHALLVPHGFALLEFPNIEALDKKIKRFFRNAGLYNKKKNEHFSPGHCNEFCRESFEYLLSKTGFKLVLWETYSLKPVSNFIYNRWHIGNKARALIQRI